MFLMRQGVAMHGSNKLGYRLLPSSALGKSILELVAGEKLEVQLQQETPASAGGPPPY